MQNTVSLAWLSQWAATARDNEALKAIRHCLSGASTRRLLLILAGLLFAGGAFWSFRSMHVAPGDLRFAPLLMLAGLIVPSLIYGGVGFILLARSAGLTMPLPRATIVAAHAYLAELLPIPGGAIVRTRALMRSGSTLRRSSLLVIATAILWIALAMVAAGLALLSAQDRLGWPLVLAGSTFSIVFLLWLGVKAGVGVAAGTLFHRLAGIGLTGLRLQCAFAALGMPIAFPDTLPFVLASLLGSASSIAPAGLGVSESLAALVATARDYPAGIAFLAVGIDRLFCLGGCGILALAALVKPGNRHLRGNHAENR